MLACISLFSHQARATWVLPKNLFTQPAAFPQLRVLARRCKARNQPLRRKKSRAAPKKDPVVPDNTEPEHRSEREVRNARFRFTRWSSRRS